MTRGAEIDALCRVMSVEGMRHILAEMGEPTTGSKRALADRLLQNAVDPANVHQWADPLWRGQELQRRRDGA